MTSRKRKVVYWILKITSIIISCALPIWAILERFPLWGVKHGTFRSVGAGCILSLLVVLFVFRRTVFSYMKDRLKIKHTPPIVGWIVMLVLSYALMFVNKFLNDVAMVCWMGFIGCGIGTLMTFIAENFIRHKEENDNNGRT